MKKLNQLGFTVIEGIVVLFLVALIAFAGWMAWRTHHSTNQAGASVDASGIGVSVRGDHLVNSNGQVVRLLGVDASGTEYACMAGQGFSPAPLNDAEAAGMVSWHIKIVRVPLNEDCWLGINGAPAAYSGANYQKAIKNWVSALNNAGIVAILDLHHSAPGTYKALTQWPMADEDHSPTFWSQVASQYAATPGVIFDLYNEPYLGGIHPSASDWTCWLNGCRNTTATTAKPTQKKLLVPYQTAGVQQLVNTVRAAGAKQPIIVAGLHNSGDPCGLDDSGGNNGTCMEISNMPKDPLNQLIIGLHTYNNTNNGCQTVNCWNTVQQAASTAGIPIIADEFGEKDCSATYMNTFMSWADSKNISYLAWTWNVNTNSSCVSGNDSSNHFLLHDWNGTPTNVSPDGADYRSHLLQIGA